MEEEEKEREREEKVEARSKFGRVLLVDCKYAVAAINVFNE